MKQETQYQLDHKKVMKVNDGFMTRATWNLLVSIRDVKLWKAGLRPHRGWKISQVKQYFGLKGNTDKVIQGLEDLKAEYELIQKNLEL